MTGTGWTIADSFSSAHRPALRGDRGAVSAAHPLAVAAGQQALCMGGSAVDAAIAAQAVLCVVAPDACGLGGDMFALVGDGDSVLAVNGAGAAPLDQQASSDDGPCSITVPGIAGGWAAMHGRWGKLPLDQVLAFAIRLAGQGHRVSHALARAVAAQRGRLQRHGAGDWALLGLAAGDQFVQPELAALLGRLARHGAHSFYGDDNARLIEAVVVGAGGSLNRHDLARHRTEVTQALRIDYAGCEVFVQPAPTQGVLLAMALQALGQWAPTREDMAEHIGVELTEAAFACRDRAAEGEALLRQPLEIDPQRASLRGGPRAYLHTAGVATADADGLVVSSLVSVFDDFGSCVWIPALGFTLNNRAGGFTSGANAFAPGKRPVHTLAPSMVRSGQGLMALATPGADGQVQTLLQVIDRMLRRGEDMASAIAAPRWRSEGGRLLIEDTHPACKSLAAYGHRLSGLAAGDMRFGSIACAGLSQGQPVAVADWRRDNWAGVA
jgi:gamma-glutamyltranspeptidase/glutathione hydrolase